MIFKKGCGMKMKAIANKEIFSAPAGGIQKVRVKFDLYQGLRFWSAFTHGLGAVLGGIGGIVLIVLAALKGAETITIVSLLIFTASMVGLYLASCLYHSINTSAKVRLFLRQLDHSMIFIFIAGTYTPICLGVLGNAVGWTLFGVIWAIAILGVMITLCWLNAPRSVTTLFYVGMGWVAVLALKYLLAALSPAAIFWMLAGGIVYTLGGLSYALKWPLKEHAVFGCHEVFHIFVLLGSVCFYIVMWIAFIG